MKTLKDCKVGDLISFPGVEGYDYHIVAEIPFMSERVFVVGLYMSPMQWLVYEDGSWIALASLALACRYPCKPSFTACSRIRHTDSLFFVKEEKKPVKKVTDAKVGDLIVNGGCRDVLVIGKILRDEEVFLIVRYVNDEDDSVNYVVNSEGGFALFKGFESLFSCLGKDVFTL